MVESYTVSMENRGEYLYVLVSGKRLTAEVSAAYWREIASECFALKIFKILFERDFKNSVSPPEMLQMGEYLGYLLPTFKVAFIDRHRHDDVNQLGKIVARSNEVMMQLFDNAEEAEQWLLVN